ncbi:hypothetical protein IFR05_013552 [Cadophora sp. M221]|nr:hypothetical protein IFR05_013552 [Cadophora sp. M221]
MFHAQPRSINVLATGKDFCDERVGFHVTSKPRITGEPFEATTVLAPLKLLRNVKQLTFEALGGDEILYTVQLDVRTVAESNDPSPLSIYPKLLGYAQCFERHRAFKRAMGNVRWYCREDVLLERPDNAFHKMNFLDRQLLDPFKASVTHPIANGLELAKFACDENDLENVKLQRKTVLE